MIGTGSMHVQILTPRYSAVKTQAPAACLALRRAAGQGGARASAGGVDGYPVLGAGHGRHRGIGSRSMAVRFQPNRVLNPALVPVIAYAESCYILAPYS